MAESLEQVPVALVDPSPYQPRRRFEGEALAELAASIRHHGLIQPIVVRPRGGRYEVIAGERRLRAARLLSLERIPCIVRVVPDDRALEAALIENLQREEISVVETALGFQRLTEEFGYSQGEIARQTGKSRVAVANTLRLLQLPEPVLELLDAGELTEGHARALLALPYPSLQVELAEWTVRNAITVREAEEKVRALLAQREPAPGDRLSGGAPRDDVHVQALEERLRRHFGTQVRLAYRRGHGSLTLEFYSDDDLKRVLELLGLPE
jgi:ParB family chromosome partitioning protein